MQLSTQSLKHQFLMAMPHLEDPNFAGTLTYLCDYDDDGTLGVVVNRPSDFTLKGLFEQLEIESEPGPHNEVIVYNGGPTYRDRGFILHRGNADDWDSSIQVADDIALTTSMDMLHAIAKRKGPEHYIVALGCASWKPGQLEDELKQNTWLTADGAAGILFDQPAEQRLSAAAGSLGVDLNLMTRDAGHA
ncbi:YqgE/AlgH family protein [Salinicola aestuarinus]|uniref:YqgE/AlgH family protein n=1 Tax=Salinicola aestuarinus TaxID=1949082 RepID=UPI000DA1AD4D|nr:YqgE/AlgH family protein [Salinicola aestuarinus]